MTRKMMIKRIVVKVAKVMAIKHVKLVKRIVKKVMMIVMTNVIKLKMI